MVARASLLVIGHCGPIYRLGRGQSSTKIDEWLYLSVEDLLAPP